MRCDLAVNDISTFCWVVVIPSSSSESLLQQTPIFLLLYLLYLTLCLTREDYVANELIWAERKQEKFKTKPHLTVLNVFVSRRSEVVK